MARRLRAGDLVLLVGDLGAGKTTFTQGLGEGLGVRGPVTSPTFVIARVHPSEVGGPALVHVDAYRLGGLAELDDLDLDASLDEAVTVVEWGEGIAEGLAESRLEVRITRERLAPTTSPGRVRVTGVGPRWEPESCDDCSWPTSPTCTSAGRRDARARARPGARPPPGPRPGPDLLLVTGDVADHGYAEEYAAARAVLDRWPGRCWSAPATTTSATRSPAGCSTARRTARSTRCSTCRPPGS